MPTSSGIPPLGTTGAPYITCITDTERTATIFDVNSGAGAEGALGVSFRKTVSGGSVEYGTSTDPVRIDPTGTTTQPVSGTITANAGTGTISVSFSPSRPTVVADAGTGTFNVFFSPSNPAVNVSNASIPVTQSGGWTMTANAGTGTLTIRTDPGYTLGQVGLNAGTNNIGDVDVLSIAAGDNNIGNVDIVTMPSVTVGSGTVTANAGTGTMSVSFSPATPSVAVTNNPVLGAGTSNIGDVDVLTLPPLVAGTANIGDVDIVTMPNVTLAAGTNTNEVVGDAASGAAKAGNPVQIGAVFNTTQPTVTTGQVVEAQATARGGIIVATGTDTFNITVNAALPAGTANIGDVDVVTLPNVTLAAGTNTNEVVGDAAHDAVIAGNPVRGGLRGVSADYIAVANGDTTDAISDLTGKQIILPYAIPENFVSGVATLTTTSDVAVIAAGGVGIRNYITSISASNTSGTNVRVDFKDGTTVIASFFVAASGGGATHTMPVPIRGTAATAFNAALSAAVTDVRVSAQGYKAP